MTSSRQKLYVHIGMYKTGSTSIQYFLNTNTDRLYDFGYHFPVSARHPRAYVQHQMLPEVYSNAAASKGDFRLPRKPDKKIIISALRQEIEMADRPNIILSSESFCIFEPSAVKEFCDDFSDFEVIPVVFLRNYADLADASYQTVAMLNATPKSFDEMGFHSWPSAQNVFKLCQHWRDCSSSKRIVVRNFDSISEDDVVKTFAEALDLPITSLVHDPNQRNLNKSINPALVVIRRAVMEGGASRRDADALVAQLGRLGSWERQTHVPDALRTTLNANYLAHIEQLLEAGLASPKHFTIDDIKVQMSKPRIPIKNVVDAVFALGRGLVQKRKQ